LKYKLDKDIIEIRRENQYELSNYEDGDDDVGDSNNDNSIKFSYHTNVTPYSFLLVDSSKGIIKAFLSEVAKRSCP